MPIQNELLLRARSFDKLALAEIYDHYSPGLYRYAMRLLGNTDMAEECVAETFSRFLQALHKGGGPREYLQAYLYRVAHNWITDHYRRQSPILVPLEVETLLNSTPGPAQAAQTRNEIQEVRQALAELTPDQRQVIVLKYLEGWKNPEIAQALDKSVGAIKALQNRAINALKRQLIREEELT